MSSLKPREGEGFSQMSVAKLETKGEVLPLGLWLLVPGSARVLAQDSGSEVLQETRWPRGMRAYPDPGGRWTQVSGRGSCF